MALASNDPANVLAGLIHAGQDVLRQFTMSASAGKEADSPLDPAKQIVAVSKSIVEMHQSYLQQMSTLWSAVLSPPEQATDAARQDDKRFASEAWGDDPRFDVLQRLILLTPTSCRTRSSPLPLMTEPEASCASRCASSSTP